ncbi:MAG: hypothetical protein KKD07_03090 [Candidatus Omnitrophica bacterium]|nr:hypothetical protein [Candidatus Omnitrophota bacterium]MBU1996483.1 hypothetical protein [Candidatus Omnitrophota bacterium]MBU4333407.1 hypothetical protein [Candidatus Omnitrophota bacterium]
MREITTLTFTDNKSQSEGVFIIKASEKEVSIYLSVLNGGDIEVRLSTENAQKIISGLEKAVNNVK